MVGTNSAMDKFRYFSDYTYCGYMPQKKVQVTVQD